MLRRPTLKSSSSKKALNQTHRTIKPRTTSENAISSEGDIAAPDAPPESQGDANSSPLEEAAFEEMLPYAAEAGSEWEPTAEPDEIFALDEIEFDDPDNLKAEALVVVERITAARCDCRNIGFKRCRDAAR